MLIMEQNGDLLRAEPMPGWGCGQYPGSGNNANLWMKTTTYFFAHFSMNGDVSGKNKDTDYDKQKKKEFFPVLELKAYNISSENTTSQRLNERSHPFLFGMKL